MFAAIVTMLAVIILAYDQLLFRPLVAFGARFRVELSAGRRFRKSPSSRDVFARTHWMRALMRTPAQLFHSFALLRLELPVRAAAPSPQSPAPQSADRHCCGSTFIGLATLWAIWLIVDYVRQELSWSDFWQSVLYARCSP